MATNSVNTKTKNTIPSFSRGTLTQLQQAITDGKISGPAFHFLTEEDKQCLAFVDIDNTIYQINVERIAKLEEQLSGLVDPETGETISVKTYVSESIEPVQDQVDTIQTSITMITNVGG